MTAEYLYQQLESWLLKGVEEQQWLMGDRLHSIRERC